MEAAKKLPKDEHPGRALISMARLTGDRQFDLEEGQRKKVGAYLADKGCPTNSTSHCSRWSPSTGRRRSPRSATRCRPGCRWAEDERLGPVSVFASTVKKRRLTRLREDRRRSEFDL